MILSHACLPFHHMPLVFRTVLFGQVSPIQTVIFNCIFEIAVECSVKLFKQLVIRLFGRRLRLPYLKDGSIDVCIQLPTRSEKLFKLFIAFLDFHRL